MDSNNSTESSTESAGTQIVSTLPKSVAKFMEMRRNQNKGSLHETV